MTNSHNVHLGGLNFAVWNVQSLQNKTHEVMEHILDLSTDLAFISETWLTSQKNDVTGSILSFGYKLYHRIRRDSKKSRGGGVGIIVRSCHLLSTVKSPTYQSFEHCTYSLKKEKHNKIILVSFYRLLHVPVKTFISEFASLLESLCCLHCNFLLAGDVNIHLDDQQNSDCILFNNLLTSMNLFQLVSAPTHNKGHTLDVVISNNINGCNDISVSDVNLSDHYSISGILDYQYSKSDSYYKTIQYRKLRSVNPDAILKDLNDLVTVKFHPDNIQPFGELVYSYNNILTHVVDTHAPLVNKTIKVVPHAPWFDSEYRELRSRRRKAEKLYRRSKLSVHKLFYTDLRKQTTQLSLQKKKSYSRTKIDEASNSNKALHATLKILTGQNESPVYPEVGSDEEIANTFAKSFVSKVENIRSHIAAKPSLVHTNFIRYSAVKYVLTDFEPTNDCEIKEIIQDCGLKSCFSDPFLSELLKQNVSFFIPLWTQLVNSSLSNGSMDNLKHADIIPLLKGHDLDS